MYPGFAKTAREEGFESIAAIFESIAVAEKQHEKRYLTLKANIEKGRVFKREAKVVWRCRNCGFMHEGKEALRSARRATTRRPISSCSASTDEAE